ncbi:MAG: energy transducer TonB [Bacteroidales bacterium]|nr:energy transducer TonB [Bacteroidales bacterium]
MIPTKQRPQPQPQPQAPQPEMPEEAPRHNRTWLYVAIAITAAVIGGGIVYLLTSKSKSEAQRAEEIYEELAELEQQEWEQNVVEEEETAEFVAPVDDYDLSEEIISIDTHIKKDETPNKVEPKEMEERVEEPEPMIVEEKVELIDDSRVYTSVEQMPQFPGGEAELLKWISTHIKYPAPAMENNIQGKVVVQFVVTRDGSIGEVKISRGKDPDLDKEAMRVVRTLPKFIPGKINGQAVNVWYTLPINFKLQGI